jgi:hypothetical protein
MTALYEATAKAYRLMEEQSEYNEFDELIFQGHFTRVFQQCGASSRWYTAIRKLLDTPTTDPCITVHQRGNVHQPSIIRLNHPPSESWEKISADDLTGDREHAMLLAEVEAKVNRLDAWRESIGKEVNLSEALRNLEDRVSRLERKRESKHGSTTKAKTNRRKDKA